MVFKVSKIIYDFGVPKKLISAKKFFLNILQLLVSTVSALHLKASSFATNPNFIHHLAVMSKHVKTVH